MANAYRAARALPRRQLPLPEQSSTTPASRGRLSVRTKPQSVSDGGLRIQLVIAQLAHCLAHSLEYR